MAMELLGEGDKISIPELLKYEEAAQKLRITTRTLRRRIAAGWYETYGEGVGKRILANSIVNDIYRNTGKTKE